MTPIPGDRTHRLIEKRAAAGACALPGDELADRVGAWRSVMAKAADRRTEGKAIVATYPRDPELLDEMRRLVEAEARCCPSMAIEVDDRAEGVVVTVHLLDEPGGGAGLTGIG